jgi:tetratricopeptide (TPR) repeat protein
MPAAYVSELERLLDRVRDLLGDGDDTKLPEANSFVNQALQLRPDSIEGWLLKCQIASATGDDLAALAAVEMALQIFNRGPLASFGGPIADLIGPPEALYWRGAVLGDLGRHREALSSIEGALHVLGDEPHWLLEELFHEKVTMLDALGLHDAAVAACAAGLERCPGSALLRAAMAPAERARVRGTLRVLRGGQ